MTSTPATKTNLDNLKENKESCIKKFATDKKKKTQKCVS